MNNALIDTVLIKGNYIGTRKNSNFTIRLYLYDDVFYEVWYSQSTYKIEKFNTLDDSETLNLYIQSMTEKDT